MWFAAADIKQIGISRIMPASARTERRTDAISHIDDPVVSDPCPGCDFSAGVFRHGQDKLSLTAGRANHVTIIGTLQSVGILRYMQVVEVVEGKDELPRPTEGRIVTRAEEQISISGPQFAAKQNRIERMPRSSAPLEWRKHGKSLPQFMSESSNSVIADPALVVKDPIHSPTPGAV